MSPNDVAATSAPGGRICARSKAAMTAGGCHVEACDAAVREPQCPNNSWGAVSAAALNDVHTFLASALHQNPDPANLQPPIPAAAQSAIKSVNMDSVVLMGHSLVPQVAVNILAVGFGSLGFEFHFKQDFRLPVSGFYNEPEEFLDGNYTTILDSNGKNAITGVISYEGFGLANNTAFTEVTIPDNTFLTYITDPGSSIANLTRAALESTEGECVQYIELGSSSSHYSLNDWNLATAPHQRAPCALDNGASTTVSTQEEHDTLLLFVAELADNIIRAHLLKDTAAAIFLTDQVPDSLFVQSAELTPECYNKFLQRWQSSLHQAGGLLFPLMLSSLGYGARCDSSGEVNMARLESQGHPWCSTDALLT
ncbi:TPA: hypothetical protein ACH3X1_004431 [Trebouxia sp. C0004]